MGGLRQKLKWSGMCLLVLVAWLFIQLFVIVIIIAIRVLVAGQSGGSPGAADIVSALDAAQILSIALVAQLASAAVFALWYRVLKRQTPDVSLRAAFHKGTWARLLALGVSLQMCIVFALQLAERVAPSTILEYNQWMETSDLFSAHLLPLIRLSVVAPLVEELLFRGVLFHYARRLGRSFWVGNVVQAVAFGIVHGNLVQGIYAFFLGLALGWLRERHGSLWVPMAAHALFNTLGLVVAAFAQILLPESLVVYGLMFPLFGAASLYLLRLDGRACADAEKIAVDKAEAQAYNDP